MSEALIPIRGNYKKLLSYQKADTIFQLTYFFCHNFLHRGDRTVDQMVQAARSCKQNIAEGVVASSTSHETLLKLLNVAKASLHELLIDYEDYLRTRNLEQWGSLHPRYEKMRQYARSELLRTNYAEMVQRMNDEEVANLCITLIHQANYMLHKLLATMQDRFVTEGGIKERMFQARINYRNNQNNQDNK